MPAYPDNVIQFPGTPKPVSAMKAISDLPADIVPFLTGTPQGPTVKPAVRTEKPVHQFLTMEGVNELEFGQAERSEIEDEAQILDQYLTALAEKVGAKAVAKLAGVIEDYVASVADISYSQGLTDGALPEDEY